MRSIFSEIFSLPSSFFSLVIASIGAHYREASRSRSDAEYISKTHLATQELEETSYWIELLIEAAIVKPDKLEPLLKETQELVAIFATLNRKAISKKKD